MDHTLQRGREKISHFNYVKLEQHAFQWQKKVFIHLRPHLNMAIVLLHHDIVFIAALTQPTLLIRRCGVKFI